MRHKIRESKAYSMQVDPAFKILRELYLQNNHTHQTNTLALYSLMRFAEFNVEYIDGPNPREPEKPFKRLLVTQKYLKIGHHIRKDEDYFIILEVKYKMEKDLCMDMEAFVTNFKFKHEKINLHKLIRQVEYKTCGDKPL